MRNKIAQKDTTVVLGVIGLVLLFLLLWLGLPTLMSYGIWNWFISPVFTLKKITWLQAFLFSILLSMIRATVSVTNRK